MSNDWLINNNKEQLGFSGSVWSEEVDSSRTLQVRGKCSARASTLCVEHYYPAIIKISQHPFGSHLPYLFFLKLCISRACLHSMFTCLFSTRLIWDCFVNFSRRVSRQSQCRCRKSFLFSLNRRRAPTSVTRAKFSSDGVTTRNWSILPEEEVAQSTLSITAGALRVRQRDRRRKNSL